MLGSGGSWVGASGGGGGSSNSFETISVPSGTSPVADSATDTLTLVAGTGITITGDATTDTITIASTITQYTDELAQDAVGSILTDSSSIDFTYNDAGNSITAVVLAAGVDHDQLLNFSANKHIDHTAVSVLAGTHLTGGGTINANVTLNVNTAGLNAALDHGTLLGLGDDDHTHYMLVATAAVQDNRIARIDGTTGRLIQTSGISISDNNVMSWVTSGSTELKLLDAQYDYSGNYAGTAANFGTIRLNYTGTDDQIYQDGLIIEVENSSTGSSDTTELIQRGLVIRGGLDSASDPLNVTGGRIIGAEIDVAYFGGGPSHTGGDLSVIALLQKSIGNIYAGISEVRMGALYNNPVCLVPRNSVRFDASETDAGDTFISYNSMDELEFSVDGVTALNMDDLEVRAEIPLRVLNGAATTYSRVGGLMFCDVVQVAGVNGQVVGQSHTLSADSLPTDEDMLVINFAGTFAANANNKRVRIQMSSVTLYDTGTIAHLGGEWFFSGNYYRTGASTGSINGELTIITAAGVRTKIGGRVATGFSNTASFAVRCIMNGGAASDVTSDESAIWIYNGV